MIEQLRKFRRSLFSLAALSLLLLFTHPPAPAQTKQKGLIAGGEAPDLILMYTGDVIGYIDPCG
jgi:hypothetical protein